MKTASVRQLKNQTSELLRRSAKEDIVITSRGRPLACLVGILARDIRVRPRMARNGDSEQKRELSRLLAGIWKLKPTKARSGCEHVSDQHLTLLKARFST